MRPSIALVAASSGLANAGWLKLPGYRDLVGRGDGSLPAPRETRLSTADGTDGWTPKPTRAPGAISESDAVLELLREKRATTSYQWEDDTTCGWTSGVSSQPFTCAPGSSCRTNSEHVVGCVSGTYSPFFTVCLDMQAFKQGACASIGPQTGCCQSSSFGACGTFLWTGTPARSMYRCFAEPTIISMNDAPQAIIDASTHTTSTSTTSSSSSSTSSTSSSTTTPTATPTPTSESSSNSTGAIVGGVVGGVAGVALLASAAAWLILRRKRPDTQAQSYNMLPPSDAGGGGGGAHHPPSMAHPSQPQQYPGGYSAVPGGGGGGAGATTFPPTSPYVTTAPASAFDPRQSYYDPSKPSPQLGYGGGGGGVVSPPLPGSPPGSGGYNPHHSIVSELDAGAVSGTTENPVEIGSTTR